MTPTSSAGAPGSGTSLDWASVIAVLASLWRGQMFASGRSPSLLSAGSRLLCILRAPRESVAVAEVCTGRVDERDRTGDQGTHVTVPSTLKTV